MAYDPRRAGQAMSEFMVAVLALILLIVAMVEFVPVFLDNIGLLKEVREEAGAKSISADTGMALSDRKDEFGFDVPGIFPDDSYTSGSFAEKIRPVSWRANTPALRSSGRPVPRQVKFSLNWQMRPIPHDECMETSTNTVFLER